MDDQSAARAIPDEAGATSLVHLRRQRYQDILPVHGESEPGSTTITFAAHGEDLDTIAQHTSAGMPDKASAPRERADLQLSVHIGGRTAIGGLNQRWATRPSRIADDLT